MPYVIDVMRKPLTCTPETSVIEAAKLMAKNKVGSIVVTHDGEKIVGILTERDLVRRVIAEGSVLENAIVKNFMTQDIVTVGPYTPLVEALKLMKKSAVRKLPVVKDDKLIGLITEREIINAIINESDEKITREILMDLLIP
ncbi:MAG: CBS domain-containing protein [Candidatus Odinarchaeia archaeon]